jgi:hypothetical protein
MEDPVERAIALWRARPAEGDEAAAAFRTAYADPVLINGVPTSTAQLVERARATHAALGDLSMEVIDRIDAGDRCAVVFRQAGVHIGMFPNTSTEPTGASVSALGIDVFTFVDGLIAEIWVVSELAAQLGGPSTSQS